MHTLPELPYAYNANEPYIDEQTMLIHHQKHHQGYVDKLNKALEGSELSEKSVKDLLADLNSLPESIRTAIRNNGGGHANHSLFWSTLGGNGELKEGPLKDAILAKWESLENFKEAMNTAGAGQFGSGWVFLVKGDEGLEILALPNQDSPLSLGKKPLFGIDVWEHAYYLKYQNKRPDYLNAIWSVVNWEAVEKNFSS